MPTATLFPIETVQIPGEPILTQAITQLERRGCQHTTGWTILKTAQKDICHEAVLAAMAEGEDDSEPALTEEDLAGRDEESCPLEKHTGLRDDDDADAAS